MDFKSANRTLILRGLACLLTLAGLVLLLAAVSPGTAAATEAEVPEAPRNLRVSPGESRELDVSWEAPALGEMTQHKLAGNWWDIGVLSGSVSTDFTQHSVSHTVRQLTPTSGGDGFIWLSECQ